MYLKDKKCIKSALEFRIRSRLLISSLKASMNVILVYYIKVTVCLSHTGIMQ